MSNTKSLRSDSHLIKRSLSLSGHRTSIALEAEFWEVLQEMATIQDLKLATMINQIDKSRHADHPLASTLRILALRYALHGKRKSKV
ncbi:ribbon-helix-helix domain-containing protein [Entomobacter blattae]|uniref:Ribbon-helix-helix domain protein n=1 Tax=Entomobacter blattae TaxID=2762277 RepID=A0A7H1NR09_9PROT|nr:ribbon-helix-helix domain-containing protein [Entomobacter blattae]QNT78219.1 Ribbon-helix-helix domain protein [Entomobacter blattae]